MTAPFIVPVSQVVTVNITKQTVVPSLYDFGLTCIMSEAFTVITPSERFRLYANLAAVAVDFNNTTPEYACAAAYFGQAPSPLLLMIACVNTGASETYPTAIAAAYALNQFYALGVANTALSDMVITSIAAYVQTQIMVFFFVSEEAGIITSGTSDIAYALQQLNYNRTVVIYDENLATQRLDFGWLGVGMTQKPGSFNWSNKQVSGCQATSSTAPQQLFALGKACNVYTAFGNSNPVAVMTRYGTTASVTAFYIDEIQGIDYLQISIQQAVLQLIASVAKISYTDSGVATLVAAVQNVLNGAVGGNILSGTPAPNASAPLVATVPVNTRAARIAPDISFNGTLAGGINTVVINGILSY